MEALKKSRAVHKGTLTRFTNHLNSLNENIDEIDLKERLDRFVTLYNKYDEVQAAIELEVIDDANGTNAEMLERDQFEKGYYAAISKAKGLLKPAVRASRSRSSSSSSQYTTAQQRNATSIGVNLPKLDLPKFNGEYGEWLKFRDTFKSLIHENNNLNDIQRFHYLNSSLTGEAALSIKTLGISEANYAIAWSTICSRYEDSDSLKHYHFRGLFEQSKIGKESHSELRKLLDNTNNHLRALKALGERTEHWDGIIIYFITSKLHHSIRSEWQRTLSGKGGHAELKEMIDFLENHCKYLQKMQIEGSNLNELRFNKPIAKRNNPSSSKSYTVTARTCALCKGTHAIYACDTFKQLSPSERIERVIELNLCFNCLSDKHRNKQCKFGPCKKCGKRHNNLLHVDQVNSQSSAPVCKETRPVANTSTISNAPSESKKGKESVQKTFNAHLNGNQFGDYVLLATAVVYVYDKDGNQHECRALLDPGSQVHIMTSRLRNLLKLSRQKTAVILTGIERGGQNINEYATLKLKSRVNNFATNISCLVTNEISDNLPTSELRAVKIDIPNGIELADPKYYQSRPIDLLIGAGLYYELECNGMIKLQRGQPFFKKTILGWIVAGPLQIAPSSKTRQTCNLITNQQLNEQLKQFWAVENCFSETKIKGEKDFCEQHFKKTIRRDSSGRFIVSIPFNDNLNNIGESKEIAHKRLLAIERKLAKNADLKEQYTNFMNEYESLGYMTEISDRNQLSKQPHFYLPHHAVLKNESTTTKLRVVFDGSAKTSTGLSLNDIQHIGHTVQDDLFSILVRFRQHPYVISADIAKMYRQVNVTKNERKMQRILWRSNSNLSIKEYELNTVTYGTASASFLATRCLVQLATENQENYPIASQVLLQDFYVDDMLTGVNSIDEGIRLKNNINEILKSAGMELRKWASNEPRILESERDSSARSIAIQGDKDPKTLGLVWDPFTDKLKYRVNFTDTRKISKRTILSIIAQIYDPLGLLGPAIIQAKIIMQKLWTLQLDWDESLPQDIHSAWIRTYSQLNDINQIAISRHVSIKNYKAIEFHGFCDASEAAYGACIYVCTVNGNGERTSNLLCAKSRVAPLKTISIPRLELLGAVLLSQLAHKVSTACKLQMDQWYFWSDSMVTLAWIKSTCNKYKTFIANRIAEIQELTNQRWNHVESSLNPADLISRGVEASDIRNSKLWWYGPPWLCHNLNEWPRIKEICLDELPEQKKAVLASLISNVSSNVSENSNNNLINLERFSSFTRVVRIMAYTLKFIKNARITTVKNKESTVRLNKSASIPLTREELNLAMKFLIKEAQAKDFENEITSLKRSKHIAKNSKLIQLAPFLDTDGLLRVGGRLNNANISFDRKHPIVLSSKNKLTLLLIQYEHKRLLHAGCQAVLASTRTSYWILNGKNTIKGVIRKCVSCFRTKPVDYVNIMGNLPASRITPTRAFLNCGVDYAGPFLIKEKTRSKISTKAYICIFICFVTKAIHIELATDLTTEAFLNCFKRFISRRGLPHNMYSDNATNFVGAKNDLSELSKLLTGHEFQEKIMNLASLEQINWHFIPPRAPHFGGLWEGAVKSAKYHLKRVIGDTRLTYEEFYTVLTQIEACLNSRPLSPLSNDPHDLTPLTPAHFLIGDSLKALPQSDISNINMNRLNRYQHLQQMLQHFWKRWQQEYLPQLQKRHKWTSGTPLLIKEGTMVIIKTDNTPPMHWPLGRIVATHPGKDGHIRVVSIQTAKGVIQRPSTKICILPIQDNED